MHRLRLVLRGLQAVARYAAPAIHWPGWWGGSAVSLCQELDRGSASIELATGPFLVRRQCVHSLNPACASACPVDNLQSKGDGFVLYTPNGGSAFVIAL